MFGLGKKPASPKEGERFPAENFTITQGQLQGLPIIAMINLAYKHYAFGTDYPVHLEVEFALVEKTENGLPAQTEADALNAAEDGLWHALRNSGSSFHFIARQTWNGKRILDAYADKRDATESALKSCLSENRFKRTCVYKLDNDPNWGAAKAFLKHF